MSDQASSSAPVVRFHVTFISADDGVSTCDVPCAIDGDPVDVVAQVDGVYGHLAQRTPHGGVFYTISGVSDLLPPSGALIVHVDAYGTVRVV